MMQPFLQEPPVRLTIVVGSTREGRFAATISRWFAEVARARPDIVVDVLDLAEARLPDILAADAPAEVHAALTRLAAADAFVIVTPEYNHSFPAPLKTLIDWSGSEWRAKPVGFVSYGGLSGGLRAVEQLRLVLAEMHAVTVRDTVSFPMAWARFDADGQVSEPEGPNRAAAVMLDHLVWWALALRDARAQRAYGAAPAIEAA